MNKIILMGRLTRNPDIRYAKEQDSLAAIARFSLAVNRRFTNPGETESADFFNCTAFGKSAEFTEHYLKKGSKVIITGRVQNNNYTNKEGQKVYSNQIIVEDIEFAESKSTSSDTGNPQTDLTGSDGFMNIPDGIDEKLPFN